MRVFPTLFLLAVIAFHVALAEAATPTGKRYFDMPVAEWLELSGNEKVAGARELLSLNRGEVSRQQAESVVDCMNAIGRSPLWISSTAGTLLTKCSFDMGVTKSASDAEWDALVECVKKEVPDFTKEELFSLGLSAAGAALAKDAESEPILTPRTKRILPILDSCGKR